MEKDLIINSSLIISFLFVFGQLAKDSEISPASSLKLRFLTGFIFGILGSCLMIFSIEVSDTIIVDMRYIALILSVICGGWVSVLLSIIIMSITRITIFGFNEASLMAVLVLVALGVCSIFILRMKYSEESKYWLMILLSILFFTIAFDIVINNNSLLLNILLPYILIILTVAFFSYSVYKFIKNSNELYRRYKQESKIDYLTGLYNFRQFDKLFDSQIEIAKESTEHLSVLTIDIDHFKIVNDTYGHQDGDQVLQKFGLMLKKATRQLDIVARCGGEEFTILLHDCPHQKAIEIAERIRTTVEREKFPISNGKMINITISIGVSSFPETTDDMNVLLKQADIALYEAKRLGRNRVCSHKVIA